MTVHIHIILLIRKITRLWLNQIPFFICSLHSSDSVLPRNFLFCTVQCVDHRRWRQTGWRRQKAVGGCQEPDCCLGRDLSSFYSFFFFFLVWFNLESIRFSYDGKEVIPTHTLTSPFPNI